MKASLGNDRNARFGWISIAAGVLLGLALGLFSFDGPLPAPERFQDYGGLSRRLLRLSHIAFIALGALNVIYAREPGQGGSRTGPGGGLLLAGSALLPPVLALAAFFPQVRFAVGPPALLVALGCVLIASVKRKEKEVLS
jgi:hypothetical protein